MQMRIALGDMYLCYPPAILKLYMWGADERGNKVEELAHLRNGLPRPWVTLPVCDVAFHWELAIWWTYPRASAPLARPTCDIIRQPRTYGKEYGGDMSARANHHGVTTMRMTFALMPTKCLTRASDGETSECKEISRISSDEWQITVLQRGARTCMKFRGNMRGEYEMKLGSAATRRWLNGDDNRQSP